MKVDQALFAAAAEQLATRWPRSGGVAAAVYLDDDTVVTSVSLDNINAAMTLCAETGAICQAYTLGRAVTASICLSSDTAGSGLSVLAPCGACQERLALWGPDVDVAVADGPDGWSGRPLHELNPHYWAAQFTDGNRWPTTAEHAG